MSALRTIYIGLMSGTSLDGTDAVACRIEGEAIHFIEEAHVDFPDALRQKLIELLVAGENEMERMGEAAIGLSHVYAEVVQKLLNKANLERKDIAAIGVHGQTVRHCPQKGFTVQLNNPSLVAELTGIDVIADFRSRDMAAGGEGAPLVPAFHQAVFANTTEPRAIVNIGGIANVSLLADENVLGFDCGPGNTLLDNWCEMHTGKRFDCDAAWAKTGTINCALLDALLADPYFVRPAPKSTGREYFNLKWLKEKYPSVCKLNPADVERTLVALTAHTIADAVRQTNVAIHKLFICGGGAFNPLILSDLAELGFDVQTTAALDVHPMHVESMAFAWLAWCFMHKKAGNLPAVTKARGPRILGAHYPA